MRVLFVVLIYLLFTNPISAEESARWIFLGEKYVDYKSIKQINHYYLDSQTIKKEGDNYLYRVKRIFSKPVPVYEKNKITKAGEVTSVLTYFKMNCNNNTIAELKLRFINTEGSLIRERKLNSELRPFPQEGVQELKTICSILETIYNPFEKSERWIYLTSNKLKYLNIDSDVKIYFDRESLSYKNKKANFWYKSVLAKPAKYQSDDLTVSGFISYSLINMIINCNNRTTTFVSTQFISTENQLLFRKQFDKNEGSIVPGSTDEKVYLAVCAQEIEEMGDESWLTVKDMNTLCYDNVIEVTEENKIVIKEEEINYICYLQAKAFKRQDLADACEKSCRLAWKELLK